MKKIKELIRVGYVPKNTDIVMIIEYQGQEVPVTYAQLKRVYKNL